MRRKLTRAERETVYNKYDGHCAYCGREIPFKGFNVDHLRSLYMYDYEDDEINSIDNLMPSCRSCNQYKATMDLEKFRHMLSGIPKRLARDISTYNIAIRYGMIEEHNEPIRFYFEKVEEERKMEREVAEEPLKTIS